MSRLVINESSLTAIGDALRVHFGENIAEGEIRHFDNGIALSSANYDEYGTAENNGTKLKAQFYIRTFQVQGAASLKLDLSYRTEGPDYIWVAEGAHKTVNLNVAEKLQYGDYDGSYCPDCGSVNIEGTGVFYLLSYDNGAGTAMDTLPTELCVCQDCGLLGFKYSGNPYDIGFTATEPSYSSKFPTNGPLIRTLESFTFEGDTCTFVCYTYDEGRVTGYFGNLYAYDADGNQITSLEVTTGRVPNDYSPAEMVEAIGKLNNYPNAKEVPF